MITAEAPKPMAAVVALFVAGAILTLSACAPPPRSAAGNDPGRIDADPPADARVEPSTAAYDLESEGEFPPPARDVVFEEDALPPPESVEGTALSSGAVEAEDIGVRGEKLEAEVETPVEPAVRTPVESGATEFQTVRGFRVQLIAASEHADANRLAREAKNRLGVAVHVDYEPPYYKVRAGDFLDRGDAILLRDRAKGNGYDGAWVVTTEIVIPVDSGS